MTKLNKNHFAARFVICVKNEGYHASLQLRKAYQVLSDEKAAKHKLVRVIDESGEDYLYPNDFFIPVTLSKIAEKALALAA